MIKISAVLDVWRTVWPYLVAILCFLVLIVIHEFGHFIAAKLLGVRVNEFSVGFGPKIFKKQWGETTYCIGCVPFGGYCAMEGEDSESADSRAFCNKKAWRRFLIVAMGAIFNLIFGLILVAIILAPVKNFATTTVAGFYEDNAKHDEKTLCAGDRILSVDGRHIFTTYDLSYAFTNVDDGKIDMTVLRNGRKVHLHDVAFETETYEDIRYLKVNFYVEGLEKNVGNYIVQTVKTAASYCAVIWRSLLDLVTGKYGISAMSGPVGVTAVIGTAAKVGIMDLLPILALITINLGLFNLLPLPALDGGRLLFILIEMIFRKPVPQKYEAWVHAAGFVILLGLMVLITAKDIWTLIVR